MRKLTLALALFACANPLEPFQPTGQAFEPPPIYRVWYAEIEACSGRSGDFAALRFQSSRDISEGDRWYAGYWYPRHTITVREDYATDETLVKHEEMHDLLQRADHPSEYFNGRCGNLLTP